MALVFKNSYLMSSLCEWVNSVDSRMYLNRRRWIDSERDTAVCPFISGVHGRAQQWHLIHQPQEYYWASWNRTKNHLYPSCIPFLLFSHPQSLMSTSSAEYVLCIWGKTSGVKGWRQRECEWRKKWRVKEWIKNGKWQWECMKNMGIWGRELASAR